MRLNKGWLILASVIFLIPLISASSFVSEEEKAESKLITENTWNGYKHYFIDEDGRVKRPKEGDTVSEGQAYAALRAVWMNDKETFDRCYRWTEANLSRIKEKGDNLLAWHWKDGAVLDWMPASDADIDYVLSLVFAEARWGNAQPEGLDSYAAKAKKILSDILNLETYSTDTGRLYLSPWILAGGGGEVRFPVNPSYYSPAHFRVFYEYTKDERWLKLVNTAYYVLDSLSRDFNGEKGVGLVPDWCSVDNFDKFYPLEGKNTGFGWEAVRVPFRVGLDFFWFKSDEAKNFFESGLAPFIEKEWREKKAVFCEYDYNGTCRNEYENPAFYSAYYLAAAAGKSKYAQVFLNTTRAYLEKEDGNWYYESDREYYVNSLAWLADGVKSGVVADLSAGGKSDGN